MNYRGLAVVFAEDVPAIAETNPPGKETYSNNVFNFSEPGFTDSWRELCPIYNALPSGS